jgi:hypothetical protein
MSTGREKAGSYALVMFIVMINIISHKMIKE